MKTVLLMLNGATLDGQPHLLEFLIGNSKWLTTNNPFQCISFEHVHKENSYLIFLKLKKKPYVITYL